MSKSLTFIDSFAVLNGTIKRIEYHQNRINQTQQKFWPRAKAVKKIELKNLDLPQNKNQLFKGRLVYGYRLNEVTYSPYQIRAISSLKLIKCSAFDYTYKYEQRSILDDAFQKRGDADDILFCIDGGICDTYYGNILFSNNGSDWVTPRSHLLNGTMRQYLLAEKRITESTITLENYEKYSYWKVINGVMGMEGPQGLTKNIL